ncbi:MAG: DMT family transporter [Proteobacteria bacterium]|nr:DMT family transporter [Pseudomonadota bacterium]
MKIASDRTSILKAAFWMSGTLLSFIGMAIGGKELSIELGTFQILFFRSLSGIFIVGILLKINGWQQIKTANKGLHLIRNLAHFGGQFGWFYGLAFIPLAEVFAIEFTIPIWATFLAVVFLKERLTNSRVVAVIFGIIGMLIILRPGLTVVSLASTAVLLSAMGYAVSHILTKKLSLTNSPLNIIFYMTLIQLPIGFLFSFSGWVWPSMGMLPWLVVVGITGLSAHYCMTRAFILADATVVIPMDFLRLPLIALMGYVFYEEALDWLILLGALIMLGGNFFNIRAEYRIKQINIMESSS